MINKGRGVNLPFPYFSLELIVLILAGLDPSFNRTGIAIYNDGRIFITSRHVNQDLKKTFQNVFGEAFVQGESVVECLKEHQVQQVLSETPPPQGQFSPGLWCLDSMLFCKLKEIGISSVYIVGPTYVGHVHGKRTYTKTESVALAKEIIKVLSASGVEFDYGRLNHDESEALIFLSRLMVKNGLFINELVKWQGLFSCKEKILNWGINDG